jgi:hypothetical protein
MLKQYLQYLLFVIQRSFMFSWFFFFFVFNKSLHIYFLFFRTLPDRVQLTMPGSSGRQMEREKAKSRLALPGKTAI